MQFRMKCAYPLHLTPESGTLTGLYMSLQADTKDDETRTIDDTQYVTDSGLCNQGAPTLLS